MKVVKKTMEINKQTYMPEVYVTLAFPIEHVREISGQDEENLKREIGTIVLDKLKDFDYDQE